MISKIEIEMMKNAYSLMYTIENTLRMLIIREMKVIYGLDWYREAPRIEKLRPYKKSFNSLYFHELIPFLIVYPCFSKKIPEKIISNLRQLIPIRNKIAHHVCLTNLEVQNLNKSYNFIFKHLSNF